MDVFKCLHTIVTVFAIAKYMHACQIVIGIGTESINRFDS